MAEFLVGLFELIVLFVTTRRALFWLLVAVTVIGVIAIAANMFDPGKSIL